MFRKGSPRVACFDKPVDDHVIVDQRGLWRTSHLQDLTPKFLGLFSSSITLCTSRDPAMGPSTAFTRSISAAVVSSPQRVVGRKWLCPACKRKGAVTHPIPTYRTFVTTPLYRQESKSVPEDPKKAEVVDTKPSVESLNYDSIPSTDPGSIQRADNENSKDILYGAEQEYDDYEPASTWDGLERVGGAEWRASVRPVKEYTGYVYHLI
jgi:hypothetical protein